MTGSQEARVVIGIPTYNRSGLLRGAIESAITQDYDDFVVVVCDNASDDDTQAVVRSFDPARVRYHRRERNFGQVDNVNYAMTCIDSEYVVLLCDDDRLLPGSVTRSVQALDEHPTAGFVHSSFDVVDVVDEVDSTQLVSLTGKDWTGRSGTMLETGDEFLRLAAYSVCRVCIAATMYRRSALPDPPMDPDSPLQHDILLGMTIALDHDVMFLAVPAATITRHEQAFSSEGRVHLGDGVLAYTEETAVEMRDQRLRWVDRYESRISDPAAVRRIIRDGHISRLMNTTRGAPSRASALGILGRGVVQCPDALRRPDVWRRAAGILAGRRREVVGFADSVPERGTQPAA